MADKIGVYLDEKQQIIRVVLVGNFNEKEAEYLMEKTGEEVAKLKDPARLRFIFDGRNIGKATAGARRIMLNNMKREEVKKFAVWGEPGYKTAFMKIFFKMAGINKIKYFRTEEEALAWLK